jgi:RHS repeat-associated protein
VTSVSVGETAAPLSASTAGVVTSTVAYNADGLPTVMVDAVGTAVEATTSFEYDTVHREDLVAVVDGRGKEWSYVYDPDTGDLLEAVDPVGGVTSFDYNGIGWLTSVVAPKGNETGATATEWMTAFEHDDWGRVVAQVDPLANRVETTFDANGNVTSTETGLSATVTTGDVTTYAYDAVDRLETVDPPRPGARTYSYDPDGRRTGFVNELGGTWAYAYDDLGRLVSQTAPESLPSVYSWDEASRLVSVAQPGGSCAAPVSDCITYAYDPAGRPTGVDYSDPATPDITGIAYDSVGRRTAATRAGDTEAWAWDARSRLVSHTDANGRATTYGWDDTGNLVSIGYPGQSTPLTRAFDDAGQMVSVTDWASRTTTFDYDGNGNWESTVFPTSSQNSDVYAYDRADRMVGVTWKRGSTVLGSLAYAPRDAKGLVTSVTGTGTAASAGQVWEYDTRDRLVDTGSEVFGFDAATNLVDADGVLQVFDPAQRLCWTSATATGGDCGTPPADATTYGFDARGNRTSMTYPSGTTAAYGFDAENRMTSAVLPSANWDTETRQFVTLTPARIADTTTGAGTCDGAPCAPLVAEDPVTITVVGAGGVPATGATAVALTVTVTDPVGDGWLSINPVGDAAAGVVALSDGQATTLNVVAKLDGAGAVTVVSEVDADVAVDVTGYFKVASGWVPALNYWPVTPALAADSTSGTGTCDGAPCGVVPSGETDVTVAGVGGIPATGAAAVTVTVIGQNPTAGGRLRAAPNGDASAGDISWDTGSVGASGSFTVPVNPDGTITIETATATTLRLSVTGYWKLPSGTDTGLGLDLLDAPTRLIDTTTETGTCNPDPCDRLVATAPVVIDVAGQADLDEDISAVMVAVTVIDPAATGLVGISPDGVEYPGIMLFDAGQNVSASMIVPVDPATGTITVVAWAATDLAIDVIGSFTQPTRTWRYDYDTSGLRSAKELETADGTGIEARQEHTWTAAGGLPLLLAEHQGSATSYLVYGPGGTPIYQINHTGEVIYLHQDHQRSTRLVTNANGTVRGAMAYDAHGAITANTNPWILQQPMAGYTGQYHDTETGYIYLRARHYDPATGQFTSLDPLVAVTEEPFGYVYGNPANGTDPLGLGIDLPAGFCIQYGPSDDSCNTTSDLVRDEHPEVAQGIVDFSSGMLDVNPITAVTNATGVTETGQHANECSGWYRGGQATMLAVDLWAAGGLQAARFRDSSMFGKTSALFGRGGKDGGGLLNHTVVRVGWGWKGTGAAGQDVFRIGIGHKKWHIEIWEVGKALRG